jgi:ubiquinone/menaquinone biosynthesis C-methylase UbiE
MREDRYITALRYRWLTPLYDPLMTFFLRERQFKERLVDALDLRAGQRVLDVGCGTGTLTILIEQTCRNACVLGLDGDPQVLKIARGKATAANAHVQFVRALVADMPFGADSIDRIASSLLFHHLNSEGKRRGLRDIHRVLSPGGKLCIADWGMAQNLLMRTAFLAVQLLDGFVTTDENVRVGLSPLLEETGFANVKEIDRKMTLFGTLSLFTAVKQ